MARLAPAALLGFGIPRAIRPTFVKAAFKSTDATSTYKDAVATLNTVQTNHSIIQHILRTGARRTGDESIRDMLEWASKLGYKPEDFDQFRPIHVAGTKGKGSTSAFISSILAQYSDKIPELKNVGLYTSPHLRYVRERIKINNEPLTESQFASHFFSVWNGLTQAARAANHPDPESPSTKPSYFRYLTLMAFHTYMKSNVTSAVIETGIGGLQDCTNILVHPTVTAITSLGIDHEAVLGNTIDKIAHHKAGIMKPGSPCFSAPQPEPAMRVLEQTAQEKNVSLKFVQPRADLDSIPLGLAGTFQKINASLAIEVAAAHIQRLGYPAISTYPLPAEFRRGLEQARFGGRCETRHEGNITYHLDGAHTMESIEVAAQWYTSCLPPAQASSTDSPKEIRVLIFNQQTRAASALLSRLRNLLMEYQKTPNLFSRVIFCTNRTFKQLGYAPDHVSINVSSRDVEDMVVQRSLKGEWESWEEGLESAADVEVQPTIEEAVEDVRRIAANHKSAKVRVLVIGSIHLIGGTLEVLESRKPRNI